MPDRREVFVIGDLIAKNQEGKPLPGVAQLAMQSGRHVGRAIRGDLANRRREPFRYVDKGSMATIGRNKAVAQIGRFHFSGIVAWWLWLSVHVLSLVGYRSRLAVLMEWAFAYFTWQRRSRVILEVPTEPPSTARPAMFGRMVRIATPPAAPNGRDDAKAAGPAVARSA